MIANVQHTQHIHHKPIGHTEATSREPFSFA